MPQPDILIIANPQAGSSADEALSAALRGRPRFRLTFTRHQGHARTLAEQAVAEGWPTVVAAGGDGTLNEVVNGLAGGFGRVRLGLLPLGTGNDFARCLELPEDLDARLDQIEIGDRVPCDVGRAQGPGFIHHFINMAAGGASGEVTERVDSDLKQFWGPLAYLRAAVETLPALEPYRLRLTQEGGEVLRLAALNLIVANGRHIAAGIPVAPEARVDDGLLDVLAFRACDLPTLARLTVQVLAGRHLDGSCEEVVFVRARALEVETRPPMPFNTDGEALSESPTCLEVLSGALDLATPLAPPPETGPALDPSL